MSFRSHHPSRRTSPHRPGGAALSARVVRTIEASLLGVCLLGFSGCARRAYTDVYVENMASEIRDLEDQLYEFDSEYRALEQELEALHAENIQLKGTLSRGTATGGTAPGGADNSPLATPRTNVPPGSQPLSPVPGSRGMANEPSSRKPGLGEPSAAPSLDARPPASMAPGSVDPATPGAIPGSDRPAENPLSPSELPVPKQVPGAVEEDPYDLKNLTPPTIERGEAMPPVLPAPKVDPSSPLTLAAPNDLEIELGQIPLPAHLISTGGASSDGQPARLPTAAEMPSDTRIVDIRFHPSLCRAINFDGEGEDDGLSLVLQPLNVKGQFVPLPAELLVVAIDPSRDNSQRPPGRWTLAAADVKAKLQPIGSSQGIHLSLPFNGSEPGADRLVVFVYYTLPDGRRVVAEQEIFLNNGHRQHTVWVPRGKADTASARVRPASGQRPAR